MRASSILIVTFLLAGSAAATTGTTPIRGADVRNITTSPAYAGATSVSGVTRVAHLTDGVPYSSWVGSAGSNGPWIKLDFAGTRYVSRVHVLPGCAGSNRTYKEFARPKVIALEGEGKTMTIRVADRRKSQEFVLDPPLPAASLTVRVLELYSGQRAGVCFTELSLHEQTELGALDPEKRTALERLSSELRGPNGDVVIAQLVALGPAAVPHTLLALRDERETVQRRALTVLHGMGVPSAADGLLRYWQQGPPPALVELSLSALARTGDRRAIPVVTGLMEGEDMDLGDRAARIVPAFGAAALPALAGLLRNPHEDVVVRALRAMGTVRSLSTASYVWPFVRSRASLVREAAAAALQGCTSPQCFRLLERLANDVMPSVRRQTTLSLAQFPMADTQKAIVGLLHDDNEDVALTALRALASKPGGARHLSAYLEQRDAPLGEEAVEALARSGSSKALSVMIQALRRGESRFRGALRDGIASFGARGIERLLSEALEHESLRMDCEDVLKQHSRVSVSLMLAAIRRSPTTAPDFVLRALGAARGTEALEALDLAWAGGAPSVRLEVIRSWGHYPGASVKGRLLAALKARDPLLRAEAARAAAKAGVVEVANVLAGALESGDIPAHIAVEGLARLQSTAGVGFMVENFRKTGSGMQVRLAILRACKLLQTPDCLRILYGAANDRNASIRFEALKLLAAK